MASELLNEEATIPYLLFSFQESSVKLERVNWKSCPHSTNDIGVIAHYWEFIVSAKKNIGPVILIPIITNHKPIIFYCISTLWNNIRNLLLWEFIYPLRLTKLQCLTQQACDLSLHLIPLYYVPVHDFRNGGWELHVCFVDAVHNCLLLVILLCAMESSIWKLFAYL